MKSPFRRLLSRFWDEQPERQPAAKPQVFLAEAVVRETARFITSYGSAAEPHEGIVYWAGLPSTRTWVITTVLAPEATTSPGSYTTDTVANAAVVAQVNDLRLQILAQVHGHPSGWVGHSGGDDVGAFMPYEGFYSVVVPWYGLRGLLPLTSCGIHQYEGDGFVRLPSEEIERRFLVLPSSVDLRGKPWKQN